MVSLDILSHIGFGFLCASYLATNIIALRTLLFIGNCVLIAWGALFLKSESTVAWNAAFAAINFLQILWLSYQKFYILKLTPEEASLYRTVFRTLPKWHFKQLMRRAIWKTYASGETIIKEEQDVNELGVVYEGVAKVIKEGKDLAFVGSLEWFGTVEYIFEEPAGVSIVAVEQLRAVTWAKDDLVKVLKENPVVGSAFSNLVALDLGIKLTRMDRNYLHGDADAVYPYSRVGDAISMFQRIEKANAQQRNAEPKREVPLGQRILSLFPFTKAGRKTAIVGDSVGGTDLDSHHDAHGASTPRSGFIAARRGSAWGMSPSASNVIVTKGGKPVVSRQHSKKKMHQVAPEETTTHVPTRKVSRSEEHAHARRSSHDDEAIEIGEV